MFYVVWIDKKVEKVYTSARKQMLISSLPPVITLHLKRFHQVSSHTQSFHHSMCLHIVNNDIVRPVFQSTGYKCKCTMVLFVYFKAGMNLRKVNRHVDFPLILDLAPFCSASCKVRNNQSKVKKYSVHLELNKTLQTYDKEIFKPSPTFSSCVLLDTKSF